MKQFEMYIVSLGSLILIALLSLPAMCITYIAHPLLNNAVNISEAISINDFGQITGSIDDKGVIWKSGTAEPSMIIGNIAISYINNAGDVAGSIISENGQNSAFIWRYNNSYIDLGTYDGSLMVRGINNAGDISGTCYLNNANTPFIWRESTGYTPIPGLSDLGGEARGINELGAVIGWSTTADGRSHAFLWSSTAGITDLTPDAEWSSAMAINDAGQVAGVCKLVDGQSGIFLWNAGNGSSVLTQFSKSVSVDVFGINNAGTIVGALQDINDENPIRKAFVWNASTGLTILGDGIAYDINNMGTIVGRSFDYGAVLWQPVPEPSSILTLLCGVAGVGALRLRRR